MDWLLNDQKFMILDKGIQSSFQRHNILANNIANVNTPGFKRSDVRFTDILRDYIDRSRVSGKVTDPRHIQIGTPEELKNVSYQVFKDDKYSSRNDGNNVDVEYEMAQLVKNSMYTQSLLKFMDVKFQKIRTVLKGA